jgi:hypothetical protein
VCRLLLSDGITPHKLVFFILRLCLVYKVRQSIYHSSVTINSHLTINTLSFTLYNYVSQARVPVPCKERNNALAGNIQCFCPLPCRSPFLTSLVSFLTEFL